MRSIARVINGRRVSDGAGVDIRRVIGLAGADYIDCLLYTSPSPRDRQKSRMPSSA